jgi:hypothetical protein
MRWLAATGNDLEFPADAIHLAEWLTSRTQRQNPGWRHEGRTTAPMGQML